MSANNERNLHFGRLDNGITCWDSNDYDTETRDYRTIAHISEEGIIKFYVDDLNDFDKLQILERAETQRNSFVQWWASLPVKKQYAILLERANTQQFLDITREKMPMVDALQQYAGSVIFKTEDFLAGAATNDEISNTAEEYEEGRE